jgi:hypothetical protein
MTRLLIIASLFALVVPAALAAPPSDKGKPQATTTPSAASLCKQQRRTIGMAAFRALYAPTGSPKAAMDKCLSAQLQTLSSAAKNAAMECKAEQADQGFAGTHDGKTFAQYYGANANDKNAFGKCVSSKARADVASQQSATLSAAKQCKAMRATQKAAFEQAYGTKKNAFGKCVSKLSKATSG